MWKKKGDNIFFNKKIVARNLSISKDLYKSHSFCQNKAKRFEMIVRFYK